ncbi:MAG: type II toxin-antitoxin system Phd/YefM family antitoxin [Planctomycetota bacterium]|nr:type II toxin-antitoxin system Phd/YefM family antitoxin [Planctomycetota bacterium]
MKTVPLKKVTASLAKYAKQSRKEPLLITSAGKAVAVVLPLDEADVESVKLSMNPEFIRIIERSRKSLKARGGLSDDEMRRRLGLASSDKQDKA